MAPGRAQQLMAAPCGLEINQRTVNDISAPPPPLPPPPPLRWADSWPVEREAGAVGRSVGAVTPRIPADQLR